MADMQDFARYRRMCTAAHFLTWEINHGEMHPRSGGNSALDVAKEISGSEEKNPECVLYDLVNHIESEYAFWQRTDAMDKAMS